MKPLGQWVREYLLALQFFTRIPVTGRLADWVGYSPDMLRASAAHFPGVGVVVGLWAAAVYALLAELLPASPLAPLVAAALSTVATVLLTGGFHEDGLADLADGLGGSLDRDRALAIMKDSRVGAFGAMALVLALMSKVALLALLDSVGVASADYLSEAALPAEEASAALDALVQPPVLWDSAFVCAALVAAHAVSRGLPLLVIHLLPHVGDAAGSKSKPMADQIAPGSLLVAGLWCAAALALAGLVLAPEQLAVACSFALVALLWMAWRFKQRLQGFTGDCLGATQQVCEIAFYLGLAIA